MKLFGLLITCFVLPAIAQAPDVVQAAKKEGEVILYTSLVPEDLTPLTAAFEKKYGVKLKTWRANSEKVLARAVTEMRAGRNDADVVETNGPQMESLYREKGLQPLKSQHLKDLMPQALQPHAKVHAQACPLFVPLVEEGWFEHPAAELIAREYLEPLRRAGVDVLVLGCTHYPLLKPLLARVMGPNVQLVDSAEETATVVAGELQKLGLLASGGNHDHRFVVSDDEPHFRRVGALFLGEKLKQVEVVPL